MYSEKDWQQINRRWQFFLWILAGGIILSIALLVVGMLYIKTEVGVMVIAGLVTLPIAFYVFYWGGQLYAYRKFLSGLFSGLRKEVTGVFWGYEKETIWREGVEVHVLLLKVDPYERPVYIDANKEKPDFKIGQTIQFTLYGYFATDYAIKESV